MDTVTKQYTITEVCNKFNISTGKLRYIEKKLNLQINRNNVNNRFYTEEDISIIDDILTYKSKGISYKNIKSETIESLSKNSTSLSKTTTNLSKSNDEVAITTDTNFMVCGENINETIGEIGNVLTKIISNSLKENLMELQAPLCEKINEINKKLDSQLTKEDADKHFKDLDNKMFDLLEKRRKEFEIVKNSKKSLLKRIFNK